MKSVLVTGGAGFIGSHLCESLLETGHTVVGIDNLLTGSRDNIQHLLGKDGFYFVEEDMVAIGTDYRLPITDYQTIFHLASPASPNPRSPYSYLNYPLETLLVNSVGTRNMLELAKEKNARFIYASSSEVYGNPLEHPQQESYWGNVNPVGVRSCYDEGKRFGEALCMAYFRKSGMDIRVARIFNTYGPRMLPEDGRVVSNFVVQALRGDPITVYGDGTQTRSFCFISDMVDGLVKLAEIEDLAGEVINLGNPDERRILDLAELVKKMTGSDSELTYSELPEGDPSRRMPEISKAKKKLRWQPEIELEDGLNKTVSYFNSLELN